MTKVVEASVSEGHAAEGDYGEWLRFRLADGRTVYVWGCGCCSSPALQYEAPEGVEWVDEVSE